MPVTKKVMLEEFCSVWNPCFGYVSHLPIMVCTPSQKCATSIQTYLFRSAFPMYLCPASEKKKRCCIIWDNLPFVNRSIKTVTAIPGDLLLGKVMYYGENKKKTLPGIWYILQVILGSPLKRMLCVCWRAWQHRSATRAARVLFMLAR